MVTAFISHNDCARHDMGPEHPESPQRLAAINNELQGSRLEQELMYVRAEEALREQLQLVHPELYLHQLDLTQPTHGRVYADPDTVMMADTLLAARLAAGAAVQAVDLVLSGQAQNAFCAVRPPGHHAERTRTMGFCFYNNIAIAAKRALTFHQLERVAIVDFDVHQGNGTVDVFQNDERVLVCSSFQHPFYPHSHYWDQPENIINTPLAADTSARDYRVMVERDWLHRLQDFKPQLVLVSAGFDGHRLDPMADQNLEEADYRWLTEMITDVAAQTAFGRVVSILEGGYHLKALASSVATHLETMLAAGK